MTDDFAFHLGESSSSSKDTNTHDLVGEPYAVLESDPGVFTSLIRRLGFRGVEVDEVYDIQPWALDHLQPRGLILCFTWQHDQHRPQDFEDPAAQHVWFANQLSDDACASQAILNVLFNCPDVEMDQHLQMFKEETESMNSVMKGLAVSNLPLLCKAQNALARPIDIRGSLNTIAEKTRDSHLKSFRQKSGSITKINPTAKPRKNAKPNEPKAGEEDLPSYHFIGYVPANGKVWELDGLKSGPLEVGELESHESTRGWEDIVRPALRLKMKKYGGGGDEGGNIQFNLLAVVADRYEQRSDQLELLKRERIALERRLNELYDSGWTDMVDPVMIASASETFTTLLQPLSPGPVFAKDFGSQKLEKEMRVLSMSKEELLNAWEICINAAIPAKVAVDEEARKAMQAQTDHVKRTYDYEPFIREYIKSLCDEGLLLDLLPTKVSRPRRANASGSNNSKRTKTK